MIDLENTVFNTVATALRTAYNGIMVYGEYVASPESFPCVNMWESDNSVVAQHEDNTSIDNYVSVTYTVQIFTNTATKKSDAKAIGDTIDTLMTGMRFRRTLRQQVPNIDRTIYRIEMRYTGLVKLTDFGTNNEFYQVYPR